MTAAMLCLLIQSAAADPWPTAGPVEAQPLLAQAQRVAKALEQLGAPLPADAAKALAALTATDGAKVAEVVQKVFDPLCMAAVELDAKGIAKATAAAGKVELVEQGWRPVLVKVLNPVGSTAILRTDSASARAVANAPATEVPGRWLGLSPAHGQPLLPNLGGLGLEYVVVFVSSRDAGEKTAELTFALEVNKKLPGQPAMATAAFAAKPAQVVTFKVSEFDGTPTTAAFVIVDEAGRVYPNPAKRLAPDFFFQKQVYRGTGETVKLPAGRYVVMCSRGPESVPETKPLVVGDGPAEFRYTVTRWIDPAARSWWSGDHHIHAAGCAHYEKPTEGVHPPDMLRHIVGEDLKVGCCLTWGPCFDYQKRFFTGKPDDVSKYPYILRYDVEVSGFGSHQSGHLNLLRLKEQIPPGGDSKLHWPTLGMNTLRWAQKQGAVCGPAHSGSGLTRFVGRVPGAVDGPGGLPNFNVPAYDGIGANEFIVQAVLDVPGPDGKPVPAVDFISAMDTDRTAEWNMWYHVLNCGSRCRVSGETDFPCISGERVGMGRVYVKVPGKLDFDAWAQGIADGRSYVSDGRVHLMDFTADRAEVGVNGSEVKLEKAGKVTFAVRAAARVPGKKTVPVELVVNGLPTMAKDIPADGTAHDVTFPADIAASSWVAVRVVPGGHTNPFFVVVGGKPIRASKHSAEWCLAGVDQCWKMKKPTYRKEELKQAEADYDAARAVYRAVIAESAK